MAPRPLTLRVIYLRRSLLERHCALRAIAPAALIKGNDESHLPRDKRAIPQGAAKLVIGARRTLQMTLSHAFCFPMVRDCNILGDIVIALMSSPSS